MLVNSYFQMTSACTPTRNRTGADGTGCWILRFSPAEIAEVSQFLNQREGFEIIDGEVWHHVTPELLGWMERQISHQMSRAARYWSDDLGAAIDLFHAARDASGLLPAYKPGWCPPEALPSPLGFEDQSQTDQSDSGPQFVREAFPSGLAVGRSVVVSQPIDQMARTLPAGSQFDVCGIHRDSYGRYMVDLSRDGKRLVCGVSPDRITL